MTQQKRFSLGLGDGEGQMTVSLEREIATYARKLPELQMQSGIPAISMTFR
jgi:hypothetical protein